VLQFGTDEAIGYALPGALNGLVVMFVQRSFTHPRHPRA
jgi:hypothetical protein